MPCLDESGQQRVYAPLEYETIILDEAGEESQGPEPYVLAANRLQQHVRFASAAKAAVRNTGLARFRNTAASAPGVTVETPDWVVTSVSDLNVLLPESIGGMSWGDARAALEALRHSEPDGTPRWQVVPEYEVAP